MRYRKIVKTNGVETARFDYVYSDGTLILLTYTANGVSNTARFVYDSWGEPRGFMLNDSATYLYLKNAQGDITGIVDENGAVLLTYSYTAWGEVTFSATSMESMALAATLSNVNPFTYRGYCYDGYAGFYYLQSRYYDSNTGRFINADDTNYLNATGTVLGCNLFAYCENDGVNRVDPRGNIPASIAVTFATIGVGGVAYNRFLCVRLYCWGFTHRKKNQTYDFSDRWENLIEKRIKNSETIKSYVSKKIKQMKKNEDKKKTYKTEISFYPNMKKSLSDLDLTLAIGSGGQFKITIKKTKKVNWKNQNYYDVTVKLIDQEFNFETWEMQIGNLYVEGIKPHTTNPLVILINNVGSFTEDYGKFISFKWGFSVNYRTAW